MRKRSEARERFWSDVVQMVAATLATVAVVGMWTCALGCRAW